jgi:hypothetical protein
MLKSNFVKIVIDRVKNLREGCSQTSKSTLYLIIIDIQTLIISQIFFIHLIPSIFNTIYRQQVLISTKAFIFLFLAVLFITV